MSHASELKPIQASEHGSIRGLEIQVRSGWEGREGGRRRGRQTPVVRGGRPTRQFGVRVPAPFTIWSAREVEEEKRERVVEKKVAMVLAVVAVIVVVVVVSDDG